MTNKKKITQNIKALQYTYIIIFLITFITYLNFEVQDMLYVSTLYMLVTKSLVAAYKDSISSKENTRRQKILQQCFDYHTFQATHVLFKLCALL